jgi:peptidoglycan hydrolase-like protein with peptidoglycan-binding domain
MMDLYKRVRNIAFSVVLGVGMVGLTGLAYANGYSRAEVRSAQQQLKSNGYYNGAIDGVDGAMTQAAIRKYQSDNNLAVNGRLDTETCQKLGVENTNQSNSANRNQPNNQPNSGNNAATNNGTGSQSAAPNQAQSNNTNEANRSANSGMIHASPATVMAAQRSLREKGFYKGNINGNMDTETQAAIREFQTNSNLNPTGQLDQATLSNLGVSK